MGIEGEERDQLVVIGDGVDATCLASGLRKKVKVGRADIVKVEAVGDEKEATTRPPVVVVVLIPWPGGRRSGTPTIPATTAQGRASSTRTPATALSKTLAPTTRLRGGAPSCSRALIDGV